VRLIAGACIEPGIPRERPYGMRGMAKVTGNSRADIRLRLRVSPGARLEYTGCLLIRTFNTQIILAKERESF